MEELRRAAEAAPAMIAVDLLEADDAYLLLVDLPGANAERTDIELIDAMLRVRSERADSIPTGATEIHIERPTLLEFELPVPVDVDASGASASLDKGVLEVRIPRERTVTERSIPIEEG